MSLRGMVALVCLGLFCGSTVSAEQASLRAEFTSDSLKNNTAPITVLSDSKLVKEYLKEKKLMQSVKSKKQKQVMASGTEVKDAASSNTMKKQTASEVIQLEIPENLQKVVNTGAGFVFQDITVRDKESNSAGNLINRQQTIESLRQASIRR